ncbi:hypothetical protein ACLX1H_011084 [Fusarium chlamydosporum]
MSHFTDQPSGVHDAYQPQMAHGNSASQHPGPLSSNPPFGAPSFQPQAGQFPSTAAWHNPESASQMNPNSNSWMPSAHQVLNNALQASGFGNVQAGMGAMGTFTPSDGPVPNDLEPPVAPPNSPAQGAPGLIIPVMQLDSVALAP